MSINKELIFVKFPIIFPVIYFFILYLFPNLETYLIFFTILILAETHFGATWPFFLRKSNLNYIIENKIFFIFIPILIIFFSLVGFFLTKNFFLLIFFAANVFHVTRQSYGVSNLYVKNNHNKKLFANLIYIFNSLFFMIGIFRFYVPLLTLDFLIILNVLIILSILYLIYYLTKNKVTRDEILIVLTGIIIFYPICFVDNPVHAIIMGVTMHYSQYLYFTLRVVKKESELVNNHHSKKTLLNFLLIIIFYSIAMSILSLSGKIWLGDAILKNLIIIPIIGQMLHFYLDSRLWKFSEKHNRENILKYLI